MSKIFKDLRGKNISSPWEISWKLTIDELNSTTDQKEYLINYRFVSHCVGEQFGLLHD